LYRDCTSSKNKFIDELEQIIINTKQNAILLGDINIDILDQEASASYLNLIQAHGFDINHTFPTRDDACLDHVMVRTSSFQTETTLHGLKISDHAILSVQLRGKSADSGGLSPDIMEDEIEFIDQNRFIENVKKENWNWIEEIDMNNMGDENDVNIHVNRMFDVFGKCQLRAVKKIPKKVFKKNIRPRQPWANADLIQLIKRKSIAYNLYRKNGNNDSLKENYKTISKLVEREMRKAKLKYYDKLLEENKTDPKKYWEIVNEVRGKTKTSECTEIEIDGKKITDVKKIATKFNEYFIGVPKKLREYSDRSGAAPQIATVDDVETELKIIKERFGGLKEFQVTQEEVEKVIRNLKNKKSRRHDEITNSIVRSNPIFFAKIWTPLLNLSIKQGKFPDKLKLAVIVPIFKQGNRKLVENYRPIALLSVFTKICESCVKEKLLNYLEHINFFTSQQNGFLKDRSTDTAIFSHITDITNGVEQGMVTMGVYLDFAKAFDTVDHKKLISILKKSGIEGPLLKWFESFLEARKHCVKIGGKLSEELLNLFGVPQGSVLGPILYIIYINGLYQLPLNAKLTGYADDTALLYIAASITEIQKQFMEDCKIMLPWFHEHSLFLNKQKCTFMIYAYKTPFWAKNFQLYIDIDKKDEKIEKVGSVKYLGVIIDEKLTWKEHSIYLQHKLRKLNFLFYHLKSHFKRPHLVRLYTSLNESVLRYGIIHWGAASKHVIKPLQILQNKVLRNILSLPPRTTEALIFSQSNTRRLEDLHRYSILMFIFKNKGLFQVHDTIAYTRTGGGMIAAACHWKKHHSRVQGWYQGVRIFNKLPSYVRNEKKLGSYKKQI